MADPLASARKELDRRLLAAAVLLAGEHRKDLSKTYPPASKPGQFPAARTLNLRDSVTVVKIPGGWRVGYLTTVAGYLPTLAARGRLTVLDTAVRVQARMAAVIRG